MIEALLGPVQRGLMQGGVLLIVGVGAWMWRIGPTARTALRTEGLADAGAELWAAQARVRRFGGRTAVALLSVWALGLTVQVMGFRDPFVPLSQDVWFLLGNTFWGKVWLLQGVMLALVSVLLLRPAADLGSSGGRVAGFPARRFISPAEAGLILALPITLALSSHAMAVPGSHRIVAVAADASHALAGGTWLGSLALILLEGARSDKEGVLLAAQLRAFSPMAILAVGSLLSMGVILSVYHLNSPSDLWSEPYGRILSAKVILVGVTLFLGFLNWRRGLPALGTRAGRVAIRRRAGWEVAAAGTVITLTAVLTGTPSP